MNTEKNSLVLLVKEKNHPPVVLIEDIDIIALLKQEGYTTVEVHTAATGLSFLHQELPAAIIVDVPDPSDIGVAICRSLKQDILAASIPLLYILPSGETHHRESIFKAGATDYLFRPIVREEVLARLESVIRSRESQSLLDVTRQQLHAADLEVNRANHAKNEFLARMNHEIRTPMNGVIGMSDLLLDSPLSIQQREYAETIRHSGQVLLSLINDLLDVSGIERGQLNLEQLGFDLRVTLDEISQLLALPAQQKGLEWVYQVEPDVPSRLNGDPGRLRQIMLKLAGNAIKFTHSGQVAVKVTLESEDDQTARLRFSIQDSGIGIHADQMDTLFDAFTQADGSLTRKYGGAGLGLAIAKMLTQSMGGEMGVKSQVGQGATFWFILPFLKQPPLAEHAPCIPDDPGLVALHLTDMRILVVDHQESNRHMLSQMMTSWSCRFQVVADGETALLTLHEALGQGDPFGIVLIDMHMPGLDGETLGRKIKAETQLRDTTLVMMTQVGFRGDAERLEKIGFSAYLTKPLNASFIYDCLTTALYYKIRPASPLAYPLITRHSIAEARRSSVRILMVEDNVTNQQVAKAILEKLGYRADVAENGLDAIHALATTPYQLVLMDCQMPIMDGYEATRRIRQAEKTGTSRIPVIALTANVLPGDREACLAAGMDDYLAKPVNPRLLAEIIDKWLWESDVQKKENLFKAEPEPPEIVFDGSGLLERLMGDRELVKDVLEGFVEDMPRRFKSLADALRNMDQVLGRRHAHTIKGASLNIGAPALQKIAAAIESATEAGDINEGAVLLPQLMAQFELLKTEISKF